MSYDYRPSKVSDFAMSISNYYSVDLFSKNRAQTIVDIRQALFFVLRRRPITYQTIAGVFGKNHSSVIHGVKVVKSYIDIGDARTMALVRSIDHLATNFFNERGIDSIDPLIREDAFILRFEEFLHENRNLLPFLTEKVRRRKYNKITQEVYEKIFLQENKDS
jgi:hypothetical protein